MTGSELARRLGVSQKHVSCVMTGKSALTVPFALALERELEISAEFWLAREMHYRLALTRRNGGRHA
jgi:HTH-type transcriptional regulator/antitoxin HigA